MDYGFSNVWISHKNKHPLPERETGTKAVSLCFLPRLAAHPASFLALKKLFLLLA